MESAIPPDIGPLLRELVQRTERTVHSLDALLERLSRMDETIEQNRAEVREEVRRSGEAWPFPLPDE